MFKTFAAKAIVPVVITLTGFVLVCCIVLYALIREDMTEAMVRHSVSLAATVAKSTRYAMQRDDRESLRNIIVNIGEEQGVEHLRIFDKKGLIRFSSRPEETESYVDKLSSGCLQCHETPVPKASLEAMQQARRYVAEHGGEVLAITATIDNEPSCHTAACHVHTPDQQLLGILDIGLDLAPLEHTLAVMRGRIAVFTLMVLVLSTVGVVALLRRNVLLPIQALAAFTGETHDDNVEREITGKEGEIGQIAADVNRLRAALRELRKRQAATRGVDPGTSSLTPARGGSESHADALSQTAEKEKW